MLLMDSGIGQKHDGMHTTAFHDKETVTIAQQQIDQEIDTLAGSIRALKTRRNALSPISRLPPEMLSKIFTTIALDSIHQSIYSAGHADWIKSTSHVCQHWRDVALGCPNLWTGILFDQSKWVGEMLKRSKKAPLILRAIVHPATVETMRLAMSHISRTRELHIMAPTKTLESLFPPEPLNAPCLESLCLSNSIDYYSFAYTNDRYTIPDDIFQNAHRLRHLELIKCGISWTSTSFRLVGLSHLTLVELSPRPTTKQLIDVLENMSNLKTLNFQHSTLTLPGGQTTHSPPDRTAHLPCLSHMTLEYHIPECADILNHLSFPRSASIILKCTSSEIRDQDFSSLVPALSRIYKESYAQEVSTDRIRCLSIQVTQIPGEYWMRLYLWSRSCGPSDRPPLIEAHIQLDLQVHSNNAEKSERGVVQLCNAFPLTDLDTIHISDVDILMEEWTAYFGGLTELVNIHVDSPYACGLVDALIPAVKQFSMEATDIIPATDIFFPALETLVLEHVEFSLEGYTSFIDLDDLRDSLMGRYECHAEIQKLCLVDCFSLENWGVDLLSEIVVDVTWDGIEQVGHDAESEFEEQDYSEDEYYSSDDLYF